MKKSYKELQRAARAATKPVVLESHWGANRKKIRDIRFHVRDRRFTRPQGEQFNHVVMDHSHERDKPDPSFTNNDKNTLREAQRQARRRAEAPRA